MSIQIPEELLEYTNALQNSRLANPPAVSFDALKPAAPTTKATAMNRAQRRKAKSKPGGAKRPSPDAALHTYAEHVRRMTDEQLWAATHREPDAEVIESVVRDMHEDILSVLAPHFDDQTMYRIAEVLGSWYKFKVRDIYTDSNTKDLDKTLTVVSERTNTVVVGQIYRHFKGNYYRVISLAKMATSLELEDDAQQRLDGMPVVVYQSMNPEHPDWIYVRPVDEFLSRTPKRYLDRDPALQCWRFALTEPK